jgi:hypothetical protein
MFNVHLFSYYSRAEGFCLLVVLAHSANACTELLPKVKGSAAATIQESPCGVLLRTIPGPIIILNPPPVINSSVLQVATLCTIPLKDNDTNCPGIYISKMAKIHRQVLVFLVGHVKPTQT